MSTKERVVMIHYYQNAIVATTLRYRDEVKDPSHFAELKDLLEAGDEELALIISKMKGEVAQVEGEDAKEACGQEHDGDAEGYG
jgi:non-homologous end joining protein Ku